MSLFKTTGDAERSDIDRIILPILDYVGEYLKQIFDEPSHTYLQKRVPIDLIVEICCLRYTSELNCKWLACSAQISKILKYINLAPFKDPNSGSFKRLLLDMLNNEFLAKK